MISFFTIFLSICSLYFVILTIMVFRFFKIVAYPNTISRKQSYEQEFKLGKLDGCRILKANYEDIQVASPFGYKLSARYYKNDKSFKTIILCHGINCTIFQSIKYADLFYDIGFNVFVYDHRNHGESGGNFTSYGYYEKYDLKACVDYLYSLNRPVSLIGVHGESMGAAVALQALNIDDRISFCISDCAFSDLSQMLKLRLNAKYKIKCFPVLKIIEYLLNIVGMFDVHKVSPIKDMCSCTTPVLFIHGTNDTLIPYSMSEDMYESMPDITLKRIFLVPDARHTESIAVDKEGYKKAVLTFLEYLSVK